MRQLSGRELWSPNPVHAGFSTAVVWSPTAAPDGSTPAEVMPLFALLHCPLRIWLPGGVRADVP